MVRATFRVTCVVAICAIGTALGAAAKPAARTQGAMMGGPTPQAAAPAMVQVELAAHVGGERGGSMEGKPSGEHQEFELSRRASAVIGASDKRCQLEVVDARPGPPKGRRPVAGLRCTLRVKQAAAGVWTFEGQVHVAYPTVGLEGEATAEREFMVSVSLRPGQQVRVASWDCHTEMAATGRRARSKGKVKEQERRGRHVHGHGEVMLLLRPVQAEPIPREHEHDKD